MVLCKIVVSKVKGEYMHIKLNNLSEFDLDISDRKDKQGYIYRFIGLNAKIEQFIIEYYQKACICGVVIENKIQPPTDDNIRFYKDIIGEDFILSYDFINKNLGLWLTRVPVSEREIIAKNIFDTLQIYASIGKNANILKNTYIKFMCWLYFKFERVLNFSPIGGTPKILYIGELSKHELDILSILAYSKVDVVIASRMLESRYLTLDSKNELSYLYNDSNTILIDNHFNVAYIQSLIKKQQQMLYQQNLISASTNDWVTGDVFEALNTNTIKRQAKQGHFNNIFICFKGADDINSFTKSLYNLYVASKDRTYVIENSISAIMPNEISSIKRNPITSLDELIQDLQKNIMLPKGFNESARNEFAKLVKEINQNSRLNQTTSKAVQLIALYKRYEKRLFSTQGEMPPLFIVFGDINNSIEGYFLRFLAKLYVDVVIILPDPQTDLQLTDEDLYIISSDKKLNLAEFPTSNIQATTVAYEAEVELTDILYTDTGMYKQHQYAKADSLTLKTTCEEVDILWAQELRFRPNFHTENNQVIMPVIFAKISGVKNIKEYYKRIQKFIIPQNTKVCVAPPFIDAYEPNGLCDSYQFFKNGKLYKNQIINHKDYKYAHLREEMQHHLLDKIQLLIDLKLIQGTNTNGVEYTIISTLLNLDNKFLRLLQKFDFTKQNPKVIIIHTKEKMHQLEDAIFVAYANLLGCDVLIVSPTGFRSLERFYTKPIIQEHQDGEYHYDIKARSLLEKDNPKSIIERMINKWQ
ncbi:MAG: hypothetical protein BEN19_05650 [Epulopiscium sp. Nuni2H_MBin003]|nr:MAG: hypothetical protein BEN19_05650 [Epulopiscium sp. Nuni2H_MBin003]